MKLKKDVPLFELKELEEHLETKNVIKKMTEDSNVVKIITSTIVEDIVTQASPKRYKKLKLKYAV